MRKRQRTNDPSDYLDRLFGYAYSLCGDRDDARDLVQDCALKAMTARRTPEDAPAYRAWLFKILRNQHFDRLRRRRTAEAWSEEISALPTRETEYSTVDERLIDVITVKMEFSKLPAVHREILGLIDIAGFSYAEAAAHLDVPVGTVMSRVSRARKTLLSAIAEADVHPLPRRRRFND